MTGTAGAPSAGSRPPRFPGTNGSGTSISTPTRTSTRHHPHPCRRRLDPLRASLCLIGDSGTGKSHLLIGLGTAAAEAGYRVKYTLATRLVNELVEAADDKILAKTIARYGRVDLLCIDEFLSPRVCGGSSIDREADSTSSVVTQLRLPSTPEPELSGDGFLRPIRRNDLGRVEPAQPRAFEHDVPLMAAVMDGQPRPGRRPS